jgi:hypothetical protein
MKYNTSRDGKKNLSLRALHKLKQIKSTSVSAVAPKVADSKSLHNYTISPGWTRDEVDILKLALMKFGIGKWKKI